MTADDLDNPLWYPDLNGHSMADRLRERISSEPSIRDRTPSYSLGSHNNAPSPDMEKRSQASQGRKPRNRARLADCHPRLTRVIGCDLPALTSEITLKISRVTRQPSENRIWALLLNGFSRRRDLISLRTSILHNSVFKPCNERKTRISIRCRFYRRIAASCGSGEVENLAP